MENQQLSILLAENNNVEAVLLKQHLLAEKHKVSVVSNGLEAIEYYKNNPPDLVILDVIMPVMDGLKTAIELKKISTNKYIPIIFLTGLSTPEDHALCLKLGDDVIEKPYNHIVLREKILAFSRLIKVYYDLKKQRDELAYLHEIVRTEQKIAKKVYNSVIRKNIIDIAKFKHYMSPVSTFNGDVVLATTTSNGNRRIMLGDFTGHGLPAAIGALPLSDVFYSMSNKGFGLEELVREINRKLKLILPMGLFCAAGIIDFDSENDLAMIWNGGLPPKIMYNPVTGIKQEINSKHLPLGVLDDDEFDNTITQISIETGDRILMYSDGVIEATNSIGDMFGTERLQTIISTASHEGAFEGIISHLTIFSENTEQDDDITMIEIEY